MSPPAIPSATPGIASQKAADEHGHDQVAVEVARSTPSRPSHGGERERSTALRRCTRRCQAIAMVTATGHGARNLPSHHRYITSGPGNAASGRQITAASGGDSSGHRGVRRLQGDRADPPD